MATVTVCSNFGASENKVYHCFHFFPIYLPRSDGIYMATVVLAASLKWRSQLPPVSPISVLFSSLNFYYHLLPAPLQALGGSDVQMFQDPGYFTTLCGFPTPCPPIWIGPPQITGVRRPSASCWTWLMQKVILLQPPAPPLNTVLLIAYFICWLHT